MRAASTCRFETGPGMRSGSGESYGSGSVSALSPPVVGVAPACRGFFASSPVCFFALRRDSQPRSKNMSAVDGPRVLGVVR